MKKTICLLLTMALTLGLSVNVFATQVITFEEDGTGTVTDAASGTVQDAAGVEVTPVTVAPEKTYLALGSDLTQTQLNTVLGLMGIKQADLGNYNIVYVTNDEEHKYLDSYIDPAQIGTKSLTSVMVTPAEKGHGVVVSTQNVDYCTTNMYRNALITAGVEDADVIVAAPFVISGTAGLIGALKAYEQMSGKTVSDKALDAALDEMVTTSELSDSVGESSDAEELISYVKAQVAANDLDTEEEIEAAIRKGMADLNVTIPEDEIDTIVNLMMKIKAMGIDFNVLADQAEDIYAKYKDQIDAGTFDISDVKLEDLGLGKIVTSSVDSFFKSIGDAVSDFFGGLFKKR